VGDCASTINLGNPVHYITRHNVSRFHPPPRRLRNGGRKSLIGPSLSNFELSLFKNNHIQQLSENRDLQFRAEFFNVLKQTNFSPPDVNNSLYGANGAAVTTAGLITTTSTSSPQIEFALKMTLVNGCELPRHSVAMSACYAGTIFLVISSWVLGSRMEPGTQAALSPGGCCDYSHSV
jgi:hypothetical protein